MHLFYHKDYRTINYPFVVYDPVTNTHRGTKSSIKAAIESDFTSSTYESLNACIYAVATHNNRNPSDYIIEYNIEETYPEYFI